MQTGTPKMLSCCKHGGSRVKLSLWPFCGRIGPYHSMSKLKILPVETLIQCEAGRAKTMQRQSPYSPRTPKWPPSDKGEFQDLLTQSGQVLKAKTLNRCLILPVGLGGPTLMKKTMK